jgi:hypothetical protein
MFNLICTSLFFVVVMLSGCTTTKHYISPQLTIIDQPNIGEVHSAELGETLVQKGKVYSYDGFKLENTVSAGGGIFKTLTLKQGTLLKGNMFDDDRLYYTTDKLEIYDSMIGTKLVYGGLSINKVNKDIIFYSSFAKDFVPVPLPILSKATIYDIEKPNFRQELIYNGRSGDTIRILYREYIGDFLRAPFSQDVQYDLREGNVVGFKGARLEIVEATNIKIKYRVLSSFPDRM